MTTILIVDDKPNVRKLLREYLTEQGYRVVTAENGRIALFTARYEKPDLILLDIMMPEMDGYQFVSIYRRESEVPIIIITAKTEESDAVLGLELGADDYVFKPFRLRELVARIRAVLRRRNGGEGASAELYSIGDISLNATSYQVEVRDDPVNLTPTEFNLLALLIRSPGRAFTREQLIDHLLDNGYTGMERTLNVHVRNLRTKIERDPANPEYVKTVFGIGYRFRSK